MTLTLLLGLGLALGSPLQAGESAAVASAPGQVSPLLIGSEVPASVLLTPEGESFDLNVALKEKPTILIFYRGGW